MDTLFWNEHGAFRVEKLGGFDYGPGSGRVLGACYILILDLCAGHVSCFTGRAIDTVYYN